MSARIKTEPVTYVATIEAPSPIAEAVAAKLEAAESPAALAVTLFECGPGRIEVSAHYGERPARERLIQLMEGAAAREGVGALRIEALAAKNWVAEAESLRRPVRAGRFLVHGAHDRGKLPRGRFTLEIDAGLAFGTAHHATTRGCLIALDRLLKRGRPAQVLDIGTGTGILAIAAAKALDGPVIASDIDPVAVAVAAENARRNGVRSRILVVKAEGIAHPALRRTKADLLFANILLRPLLELAPAFAGALRPGGVCVLSGILDAQARQVEARFRALGFRLDSRILLGRWTTLLLRRGSTSKSPAD
ncbi:MAG TPA: 50S ribosomal protein L11 methyltransferase [Methyloceanibacter sp.]|nr:50S ribosomal protein L11 methyltransferase [Methyloceanibacter sp.]